VLFWTLLGLCAAGCGHDFEAFEALKAQVFPAIVKDKGNKGAIWMWAPGCSTGEETYSLAITLLEFLGDRAASFQVQIFGTDLNEKGIQKARSGVYRESIAAEISPERMDRFFVKVEGGYRLNKAVRDMCVFARQNLAIDPPFSQMNLVACRNLLIYIQPVLQRKIIPILHYALKPSGFLMLGGSESVAASRTCSPPLIRNTKSTARSRWLPGCTMTLRKAIIPLRSAGRFPPAR
jgi:two-component system CheB/CheR fusion protein